MNICHVAIGLITLTLTAQATGAITEIRWSGDGRFVHRAQVNPKAFVELCGELTAGQVVTWEFVASEPLDFNIHYHVGKEVVYPERQNGVASGKHTLTANVAQHYCWMWVNRMAAPVTLRVELRR